MNNPCKPERTLREGIDFTAIRLSDGRSWGFARPSLRLIPEVVAGIDALGRATETIRDLGEPHPTGLFFAEQTAKALVEAIERFEKHRTAFDPADARTNAEPFNKARFERELFGYVERVLKHEITSPPRGE